MKVISVLFCLLFLMGGSAFGDQAVPRGVEESQSKQSGGGGSAPQGGSPFGPPPEAFKACEGKSAGSQAQFRGPDGETITGTCLIADGRLVLRPDRPRANSQDDRRGPPLEAYKACEGKIAGSAAQFINPRGETVDGTCEAEDGKMVLRPNVLKDGRPKQANVGPEIGRVERWPHITRVIRVGVL